MRPVNHRSHTGLTRRVWEFIFFRTRLETLFPRQRERVRYAPHPPAAHLRPPCEAQTGGRRVYLTSCLHGGELLPLEYFPRSFLLQVRISIFNHNVSATVGFSSQLVTTFPPQSNINQYHILFQMTKEKGEERERESNMGISKEGMLVKL